MMVAIVVVLLQSLKYDEDNSRNNRSCFPTPNSFQTSRGIVLRALSHSSQGLQAPCFLPRNEGREQEQPAMPHPHHVAVTIRGNLIPGAHLSESLPLSWHHRKKMKNWSTHSTVCKMLPGTARFHPDNNPLRKQSGLVSLLRPLRGHTEADDILRGSWLLKGTLRSFDFGPGHCRGLYTCNV